MAYIKKKTYELNLPIQRHHPKLPLKHFSPKFSLPLKWSPLGRMRSISSSVTAKFRSRAVYVPASCRTRAGACQGSQSPSYREGMGLKLTLVFWYFSLLILSDVFGILIWLIWSEVLYWWWILVYYCNFCLVAYYEPSVDTLSLLILN